MASQIIAQWLSYFNLIVIKKYLLRFENITVYSLQKREEEERKIQQRGSSQH